MASQTNLTPRTQDTEFKFYAITGMRFIALFVVALIIINTASGLEQDITPKITSLNHSLDKVAITKRSLRVEETEAADLADTDGSTDSEERANVQEVSKLADLDKKTGKLLKLDMKLSNMIYLIRGKDPSDVLNYLLVYGNWAVINENKRVLQWFRFVKAFQKAKGAELFPDNQIYALLKPIAEESKLATLFQSLKDIPDLKNLAETMQKYQFKLWINRKETPKSIAMLLGMPTRTTEKDPRNEVLKGFTKMFEAQANGKLDAL